jgi:hypothetical protein
MLAPNQLVSLWDMLELHGNSFVGAAVEIGKLRHVLSGIDESSEKHEILNTESIQTVIFPLQTFRDEASNVGGRLACIAADRLIDKLRQEPCTVTLSACFRALTDIESRFADQLGLVKLFVISEDRAILFEGADVLLKANTATLYRSIWFDCEESAKSLCLGRSTASVFHTMRMLEVAIAALSKRLGIPDPAKVNRSWGSMLKAIKAKIDETHFIKTRVAGDEGSKLEEIYVSLDAIKNPWRNATMHVESVYTEEEARHILTACSNLLDKMAAIFDENGRDSNSALLG